MPDEMGFCEPGTQKFVLSINNPQGVLSRRFYVRSLTPYVSLSLSDHYLLYVHYIFRARSLVISLHCPITFRRRTSVHKFRLFLSETLHHLRSTRLFRSLGFHPALQCVRVCLSVCVYVVRFGCPSFLKMFTQLPSDHHCFDHVLVSLQLHQD